jgi:hypothetical protein
MGPISSLLMLANKSIKVVKRKQREVLERQQEALESAPKTERQARRMMFQTISSWIEEQRDIKKQLPRQFALVEERVD